MGRAVVGRWGEKITRDGDVNTIPVNILIGNLLFVVVSDCGISHVVIERQIFGLRLNS